MAKKFEEIKEEEYSYELPEGWKWERLGNVYQVNPKNNADNEIDAAFIPMAEIEAGFDSGFNYEITTWEKAKKGHTQFADGDVAFAKISPCFENRKSFIAKNLPNGIGAGTTELIILRNNDILSEYTYRFITTEAFINECKSTYSGTVGQQRIDTKFVKNYLVPLPPKETQQKIVDIIESLFAKLDIAQEKVEQVLAESENRRSAILHNAFSGKLTEKWREENNVSFDSWNEGILKNVLDVRDGTHDSPAFQEEGYPLITSKNLKNEKIIFNDIKFISKDDYDKINQRSKVEIGDILFAMIGTIGNPVVVDSEPNYAIKNVALLKSINKINPYFVKYYLLSAYVKNKMIKEAKGSTQKFVSLGYLRSFPIVIPLLKEQQEIVRLLDKFLSVEDKVKSTCQNTLESIATMRKSILAKAFRGELCS